MSKLFNITDLLEISGEDDVRKILSGFSCPKNHEIENFIKKNAIDFAKKKISITYLLIDDSYQLEAFFSVTHKALRIHDTGMSNRTRKKLERYAEYDVGSKDFLLSAFLIAQFARNFNADKEGTISGKELMETTMDVLLQIRNAIGGGLVYLECEDIQKILSFYQENGSQIFGERTDIDDSQKYIQLFRFF